MFHQDFSLVIYRYKLCWEHSIHCLCLTPPTALLPTYPFSTGPFQVILTTFRKVVIIKPIKLQTVQTAYQMNDIDHVDILIKLVFKVAFEKVEKSDIEKPIFQGGC